MNVTLNETVACALVTIGTGMQMALALPELAASKRGPLLELNAEDDLVKELPRRERRRVKRDFRRNHTPEVHRGIRTAFLHVVT